LTATERSLAPQQTGLTLEKVVELTGYEIAEIALIRHKMAGSLSVPVEQVPLRDIALFSRACKQLGLDALLNQAHWISRGGKGTLQVGIDGFRAIADRSGVYAGSEPALFRGQIEQNYMDSNQQRTMVVPEKASVVIWKVVAGHKCAFTGEAHWTEFYPGQKEGFMWRRMPRHMLGKAAEAQALRKAFPAQLGVIAYQDDGAIDGEYPDIARQQSWQDAAPVQIVEQPPRRRYEQIFGDVDHSPYDLPERAPTAPEITGAMVTKKDHPLWQEWLKAEKQARAAGLDIDTSEVKLGAITDVSLEATIAQLAGDIADVQSDAVEPPL
jgi:phage recombination protein Bet